MRHAARRCSVEFSPQSKRSTPRYELEGIGEVGPTKLILKKILAMPEHPELNLQSANRVVVRTTPPARHETNGVKGKRHKLHQKEAVTNNHKP